MSKGAFRLLERTLPDFKNAVLHRKNIRNQYIRAISRIEGENKVYVKNLDQSGSVKNVSNDLQQKHYSVVREIKEKGREVPGSRAHKFSDNNLEEILPELREIVDKTNREINIIRLKRGVFFIIPVLVILLPLLQVI
jgi:predicted transcriptional regulator